MTPSKRGDRPAQPEPYLRGCAFAGVAGVPYPRADPEDAGRLPADTWAAAQVPAGVRFELTGDAEEVAISYRCLSGDLAYRADAAGSSFSAWRGDAQVGEARAVVGAGRASLGLGEGPGTPVAVYLPEGMKPVVDEMAGLGGRIEPAPRNPVWIAYGDSIAEGWIASSPARAWPALAARRHGLDVQNLGYAGAARGEVVSAEQIAGLDRLAPAVISITHGTNCWTRVPHSEAMMRATTHAFITVVRQGHPVTPILVVSPVVRPDAEDTPNRLGATLAKLREAMEDGAHQMMEAGDEHLHLISGARMLGAGLLADGIHPGDEGHRELAEAIGPALAALAGGGPRGADAPSARPAV